VFSDEMLLIALQLSCVAILMPFALIHP